MILDPKFKSIHFKINSLLNLYSTIKADTINLLKTEFNKLNNNNDPDELNNDLNSNTDEEYDSDTGLY